MTPAEVERLSDAVYDAFVRHMQREASEARKAARGRR